MCCLHAPCADELMWVPRKCSNVQTLMALQVLTTVDVLGFYNEGVQQHLDHAFDEGRDPGSGADSPAFAAKAAPATQNSAAEPQAPPRAVEQAAAVPAAPHTEAPAGPEHSPAGMLGYHKPDVAFP